MKQLSIVIPVFNRADALPATLSSLAGQSVAGEALELIVVDDGSTDGSAGLVERWTPAAGMEIRVVRSPRRGPSAARNAGAARAAANILLFWDCDMVAAVDLAERHLRLHQANANALVGGARCPYPRADDPAFTRLMARPAGALAAGRAATFQEFLSSNLSLPRASFRELGGFDDRLMAYEDIDLAYRAQATGMHLIYEPQALGYHNHPLTLTQAAEQQRRYQEYAALFLLLHPELQGQIRHLRDKGPVAWGTDPPAMVARKLARRTLATRPALRLLEWAATGLERWRPAQSLLPWLYWKVLAGHQLLGYRDGLRAFASGSAAGWPESPGRVGP
jgi:glycosyltransferase involved in cell wall biosynthesis